MSCYMLVHDAVIIMMQKSFPVGAERKPVFLL
jgi:hypothetical protein